MMILAYYVLHVKQAILNQLAHPGLIVEDPGDRADRHISQLSNFTRIAHLNIP
jgi:hypothetical protein